MASTALLLLQLLLVPLASAVSHNFGGMSTYTYRGRNPDGTYRVDIRSRSASMLCRPYHNWYCRGRSCGGVSAHQAGLVDSKVRLSPLYGRTCEMERTITTSLRSDKPFQMTADSCCWASSANYIRLVCMLTEVDLGKRSDTKQPNRSPDIAILPVLRVPQNCPRTYQITSFDADGDKVRCRYGQVRGSECSSCRLPSGFLLDQGSCTLRYRYTRATTRIHGLELVVEDFPKGYISLRYSDGSTSVRGPLTLPTNTTTPTPTTINPTTRTTPRVHSPSPLSRLPLQFSVLVDPPVPSCEEGAFLPKFLPPTPVSGERFQAEVKAEVEIRVKAQATHANVYNMVVSGPMNISKHQNTRGEFVIRWTPLPEDLGQHFVICFAVEAIRLSAIYQSEMRCVLVDVRSGTVESHVICNESSMTVSVEKASFPRLNEDHLRLSDPSNTACSLQRHSNSTHIIAIIPLNACGTQIEEDEDYLLFKNEITTVENANDLITRKHQLEVQFYCQYPKRGNVSLGFEAHRKNVIVWEKGFGTFTYQFEFYPDQQFRSMIDPNSYPLVYEVGQRIFMKIEAVSSVNNTELFVESCRASPYDNANYPRSYSIFENGCKVDPTIQIHSSAHQKEFRFSMEAFKFIGLHNQVYISCSVMMCEAGNSNTRCSRGCMNSTSSGSKRRRRDAVIQTANHFVSQGPLRLRRSAEGAGATVSNLNLNLVFVAGCLLAAVAMVCAALLYKANASKVKYQPLPTLER